MLVSDLTKAVKHYDQSLSRRLKRPDDDQPDIKKLKLFIEQLGEDPERLLTSKELFGLGAIYLNNQTHKGHASWQVFEHLRQLEPELFAIFHFNGGFGGIKYDNDHGYQCVFQTDNFLTVLQSLFRSSAFWRFDDYDKHKFPAQDNYSALNDHFFQRAGNTVVLLHHTRLLNTNYLNLLMTLKAEIEDTKASGFIKTVNLLDRARILDKRNLDLVYVAIQDNNPADVVDVLTKIHQLKMLPRFFTNASIPPAMVFLRKGLIENLASIPTAAFDAALFNDLMALIDKPPANSNNHKTFNHADKPKSTNTHQPGFFVPVDNIDADFRLLGLAKTASHDEIRTAYKHLALHSHPDHNPDPLAKEQFQALTAAYEHVVEWQEKNLAKQARGTFQP